VHPWTVNTDADVRLCLELGVDGITTDDPAAVLHALADAR
jgi:glycerophosphoryl diester phosphodiesterase